MSIRLPLRRIIITVIAIITNVNVVLVISDDVERLGENGETLVGML